MLVDIDTEIRKTRNAGQLWSTASNAIETAIRESYGIAITDQEIVALRSIMLKMKIRETTRIADLQEERVAQLNEHNPREHRVTIRRPTGDQRIVSCTCGWRTTALYAYEARGEKASHLARAAKERN